MEPASRTRRQQLSIAFAAALATSTGAVACGQAPDPAPGSTTPQATGEERMAQHPYIGMWITDDGRVRHQLLPNNRYDEARGDQESAYRGRYEVQGAHIEYWDDTGFTADGDFVDDDTLHHGGMILRRRPPAASQQGAGEQP